VNILGAFQEADRKLGVTGGENTEAAADFTVQTKYNYNYDDTGNITDSTAYQDTIMRSSVNQLNSGGPLLSLLQLNGQTGAGISYPLTVVGVAAKNKIDRINKYLDQPNIKALFPKDVKFMWGYSNIDYLSEESSQPMYELYAIKTSRGQDKALLEGDVVTGATSNPDPSTGKITVNGAITGGNSAITGDFSQQEGDDLAKILEIGKLPAQTKIIQEQIVGPSLGAENISRSLNSMIIGLALVLIFMIAYYGGGGIVSIIALLAKSG